MKWRVCKWSEEYMKMSKNSKYWECEEWLNML